MSSHTACSEADAQRLRKQILALANSPRLLNVCRAIFHGHEIFDLAACIFVLRASGLRVLSDECSEPFSLRHEPSGLRGHEKSAHCGCDSRSDVSALRS